MFRSLDKSRGQKRKVLGSPRSQGALRLDLTMRIFDYLWKKGFIEKLEQKHNVSRDEVEEVFRNNPHFDFVAKGRVKGENVYWALGQTDAGRYLTVFFIYKGRGKAMPISARNMNLKERRRYERK